MSIQRDGTDRQIVCDDCTNETDAYDHRDFDAMITAAKEAGWTIEQDSSGYTHRCPDCRPGSGLANARRMFGL